MPPIKRMGMNTATSEMLIENTVKPISRAPTSAASSGPEAGLAMARDVLEHDDRVVDHEAGGHRQRHQREVVEAEAQQVHHAEGADQRHRHRHRGHDRRADAPKEREDHEGHEADRDQEGALHVEERSADRRRRSSTDLEVDRPPG